MKSKKITKVGKNLDLVQRRPDHSDKEEKLAKIISILNREKEEAHSTNSRRNGIGYLGHHFFPDLFKPTRFPDFLAFPTHLHKESYELIVPVSSDNKILIYYCPTISLTTGFTAFTSNTANTPMTASVFFACNGTGAVNGLNDPGNNSGQLLKSGVWATAPQPNVSYTGIKNSTNLSQTRLLSAHMTLEYTGKAIDSAGVIKAGMSVRKSADLPSGSMSDMMNFPLYSSFDADEDLMLQYRHLDDSMYLMGPYETKIQHPFILIYGEGLPSGGTYKLTFHRHFESIVKENIKELTNPIKENYESNAHNVIKGGYGAFNHSPFMNKNKYEHEKRKIMNLKPTGNRKYSKLKSGSTNIEAMHRDLTKRHDSLQSHRSNVKDWGYLLHHYFPDKINPSRFPDYMSFPTHIVSSKEEFIVPVSSDNKLVIFWNPAVVVQLLNYPWFACNGTGISTGDGTASSHIFDTAGVIREPTTGSIPYQNKTLGFPSRSNFSQCRLLAGYLEIEYIGKVLDASGSIKVCSFPKKQTPGVSTLTIANMMNQPIYGSFSSAEKFVVFYRHTEDTHFGLGPYSDNVQFPVTYIVGENLPAGGSYKVTSVRSFEGIPLDNISEFVNPLKEQTSLVNSTHIKSRYGQIDIPSMITKDDYERIFEKTFGGISDNQLNSYNIGNYSEIGLYKALKQNSTYASSLVLPTYDVVKEEAKTGETAEDKTKREARNEEALKNQKTKYEEQKNMTIGGADDDMEYEDDEDAELEIEEDDEDGGDDEAGAEAQTNQAVGFGESIMNGVNKASDLVRDNFSGIASNVFSAIADAITKRATKALTNSAKRSIKKGTFWRDIAKVLGISPNKANLKKIQNDYIANKDRIDAAILKKNPAIRRTGAGSSRGATTKTEQLAIGISNVLGSSTITNDKPRAAKGKSYIFATGKGRKRQ